MSGEFDFDDFRPRPGRIGKDRSGRVAPTLDRIGQAAAKSAARGGRSGGSRGTASRSVRSPYAGGRRVVVKARVHRLTGSGADRAVAHLRYLQRDGAGRDGEDGRFYDARSDDADGDAFQKRCEGDRHQFRFIVSPEDGAELSDLKPFVRGLITDMERDLGTKLDWVAMDHHDTEHPHTHLVMRGRTDRETDLRMPRDYIAKGIREAAEARLDRTLGPPSPDAQLRKIAADIDRIRPGPIDRLIERQADASGRIIPTLVPLQRGSVLAPAHLIARLKRLEALQLAERMDRSAWRVVPTHTNELRALATREERLARIERAFSGRADAPSPHDYALYEPECGQPVTGRVAALGLSDELQGARYAIIETTEGRALHVELGTTTNNRPFRRGDVVSVTPARTVANEADRTIAAVAAKNGGRYSPILHAQEDRRASEAFLRTHVRRLEAERRLGNTTRERDGSWTVPPDYIGRVEEGLRAKANREPVRVQVEATLSVAEQTRTRGATWLDRIVVRTLPAPGRDAGFGAEVTTALAHRRDWLVTEGYATRDAAGRFTPATEMLRRLERDELRAVAERLSAESGKAFRDVRPGETIEGIYRRPLDLASGRFAMIETERAFALVPWRDVLERNRGKEVSGVMRGRMMSWTLNRQRGLGR
ncbi:DUF3363 domain-containing protein [Parvularcula oceani]|uniref:DUF3363 domain-containing protein n=1 Tax=Parvularcula oceani TaxID=1247963 RepID=UPI0004E0F219|nr:DUF3363 domain-containing protein [Parvularcula oceani]